MANVNKDLKRLLIYFISPALVFVVWEICSATGLLDERFFPRPSSIFYHLFFVSPDEGILMDIVFSVYRIFVGYLFGCGLGIYLGDAGGG